MTKIQTEEEFNAICARIEELLPKTWDDDVPPNDPNCIELNLLSNLVADYEAEHVHLRKPTLVEIIKLRLFEMNITQKKAAEMLGISTPRFSELMNGKIEPSYKLCQSLCTKLNIAPSVVLGV